MKQLSRSSATLGFSLVEMSIVLVIIGLLVGGIFTGQSLIKAAKLRSVTTDANNYLTAANNFRSQYRYFPGDMPTATQYWSGSANGDGDNIVSSGTDEQFHFWEQLNSAGMIEKSYTGTNGGGGADDSVIGSNVPGSRLDGGGFSFFYANMAATTKVYAVNLGNMLAFGGAVATSQPTTAILNPVDAYVIDTKMDDGLPGTGKWIANGTGAGNFGTATACTTSTSGTDYTGAYAVSNNGTLACSFFIMSGY